MVLGSYEMLKMAREMVGLWERCADRDPAARAAVDAWADQECALTGRDLLSRCEAGLAHMRAQVALQERTKALLPRLEGSPSCRVAYHAARAIELASTVYREEALEHAGLARALAAELDVPTGAGR